MEEHFIEEHLIHTAKQGGLSTKSVAIDLTAGTIAGILSTYAGYPLDLIKVSKITASFKV